MPRRRPAFLSVITVVVTIITFGSVSAPPTPSNSGQSLAVGDNLLAAVLPDHREDVRAQTAAMPRYTIAATFLAPSGDIEEESTTASDATPMATPAATPLASPVPPLSASPVATPRVIPVTFLASPAPASPPASPQATPIATTEAYGGTDVAAPPIRSEPRIIGTLDLHYLNTTGEPLDELFIRLNPNLRQYGTGRMVVDNVFVDGIPVEVMPPALHSVPDATPLPIDDAGARDLALVRIPLRSPLAPDEETSVRMDFATTVPVDPPDENGLFQYSPATGTWTLAHWFPMLAGYDPVHGWNVEPPAAWSDITFANTALYDIILSAPDDLVLVTTGVEVETGGGNGYRTTRITTGPVRDVVIVAESGLASTSTTVGETAITSWHRPEDDEGAKRIQQWAAQALETYADLFGPYPYTTLDIVAMPDVIGYEFPQLVFIGRDYYADPETSGSRPGAIEFLVAHEVAHQWWYGLVGSNPHQHAFLDEGLAEYSTILYFERQYGDDAASSHLRDGLIHRYALMLATSGDQIADQPTADFPDLGSYYATVYRKAGLGFEAIRHEVGDDAFLAGLRDYAETMRFGVASPDDLRSALEAASDQDLSAMWALWFEMDRGRIEITMEPLPGTPIPATPGTPAATPIGTPVWATPEASTPWGTPVEATPVAPDVSIATVSASPVASP